MINLLEGPAGAEYLNTSSLGEDSQTAEHAWPQCTGLVVSHSQTDKSDKRSLKDPRTHTAGTILCHFALVKMDLTQALMGSKVNPPGLLHSSYALSGCCHSLSETRLEDTDVSII